MAETMILVPGRSQKQGTSLNEGKLKDEYKKVTSTAELNEKDMKRLKLKDGDKYVLNQTLGRLWLAVFQKRMKICHRE